MTPIARYTKDPDATLDFVQSWDAWLDAIDGGDTITDAEWIIPSGLTEAAPSTVTTTTATVWLSGGTAGTDYDVTCRITTDGGRIDDRTIRIQVRQR
jgi:hypothetical protein